MTRIGDTRGSMAKKLGELLVGAGTIDSQQLLLALIEQKKAGRPLGMTLVRMGLVDETTLIKVLADQLSLPLVRLTGKRIASELLDLVPPDQAEKHHCLPLLLKNEGGVPSLYVAMEDPGDANAIEELGQLCQMKIRPVLAAPSDLQEALARHYDWAPPGDGAVLDPSASEPGPELDVDGEPDPLADLEILDLDDLGDLDEPGDLGEPDDLGEPEESGGGLDLDATLPDACEGEVEGPSEVLETVPGASGTSSDSVLRALTQLLVEKGIITREELVARLTNLAVESSQENR